ncbi:uncharacterized protein I303_104093 [Kwoniella dejecticola CBS 10117]|uniref:Rhodanese domain-containing protein n=1 Tax=Kwoniella dejecticola CBS 10117 TaxID=1296121 RepID=A0A1A6A8K1_9TREE|nr:uncharacterized protein I303_04111 [Kwoniella dejecticola CBS 10117]OBR86387.1 hypothetical protein I303_04111 [Kwoniella dejecticola CBS 10117]
MSPQKSKVEAYLEAKRAQIDRLGPEAAYEVIAKKDGAILIDTRPAAYRESEGSVPGAVIVERNVLEWRLDPSSPDCIEEARIQGFKPIVMCNEGYASSLAAQVLVELGVNTAVDLEGGFRAWKARGLPVSQGQEDSVKQ